MDKDEQRTEPVEKPVGRHFVIPIPDQFDEPQINYRAIFEVFSRRRWLLISAVLIFAAASLSLALVTPRKYEASALLASVVEAPDANSLSALASRFGGLASLAGFDLGQSDNTAEAVAILNSRRLAIEFIKEQELLPVLFEDLWDGERGEWAVETDEVPSMWDAANYFIKDIRKVAPRKDDGLIQLSITWKDPVVAAKWTAEFVALANRVMRENAIVEANESLSFLEQRLGETREIELQQGIYRLVESYLQQKMIASVRDEYAFKTIDAAVAPDIDDYLSPNPMLFLIAGTLLGTIFGVVAVLWRERAERGGGPTGSDGQD